jgi:autotransporter-associated beta strand protein
MDVARNPGVAAGKPVYQQRGIAEAVGDWGVAVGKPVYQQQDLSGFRSLNIDVQQAQMDGRQVLTFNSLGASPQVGITLARRNRNTFLTWGLALAVFVLGMAMTRRPVRQKAAFVLVLALASALLPLAWDTVSFARICNGVFFAASLLVPYYLLAGLIRWILQGLRALANRLTGPTSASAAASIVLVLAILLSAAAQAQPQPAAPEPPVTVPEDAIIVPYDVKSQTGIQDANRLLVPYERYVELWNRAYPDKKIDAHPAPLPYALSGATYSAVLEGEETLNISGKLQIDVLAEGYISIPLGLRGGVLANAELDGKPARLKVVATDGSPNVPGTRRVPMKSGGTRSAPDTMDATLLVIQVSGKGTHKLALEARLKLDHLGGWRGTRGSLPTAPAATITLRVPQAQTEVRLGQAVDRRSHETQRPDETLETALGTDGALQVQWRPKVAEGEVDRGLTVQSAGLLDVQEDGLRMGLHFQLEFRRSQRDTFTLLLPADFLVEKVAGGNVRGWKVRREAKKQTVDVSLLKTAKDAEQFNLFLSCNGKVGQALLDSFVVPMVTVSGAALSSGQLTIRRSPLLDLRTTERSGGVTRTDLGALPDLSGGPATEESVLAIRPYEAYHFPTMPFVLRLSAARVLADVTAEAQTSVRLDPTEPGLESKIVFHVGQRKTYGFEIALPDGLRLPEVTLPSSGIWSIEKVPPQTPQEKPRSVLKIFLQQGVLGDLAVILRGKLPALDGQELSLPRLDVLGVKRQEGQIAVQTDEAFSVQARELRDCRETELERVAAWLDPQLRAATRLALQYTGGAYAGKLRLTPRTPEVACDTVTNVKITDRAIEETIVLNYTISNAGIRELSFLLPASMADARILANMLRRKTVSPVDPKATGSPVRVHLEFQGDVMNELCVQVQNDRLLTPGTPEAPNVAPLPTFENVAGRGADSLRHQWVVLETANRDELIEVSQGLQTLGRQQAQWQTLIKYLGSDQFYKAYLVQPGAAKPQLGFYLKSHEDVETAGARIDLALTTIVLDANGAYRAKLELSVDNSSEQFLDVELPEGATLWAAQVAGEPVKAGRLPGAADDRHVLLPVRKTAKGDLDYRVVLKYGGKTPPLSFLSDVQFPLVRHVMPYPSPADRSINIEQSQVKVYVPKSHRWFDFGGTMHRTEDEAELAAGRMAAFNKEGQRLLEATHDNDPFTRIRTAENLKNWLAESQKAQQDAGRVSNKELQSQLSANSSVTQQANDVLKSAGGEVQEGESTVDNRQRLNALYEKQVTVNGNSTLILAGNNTYNGGTTVNAGTLVAQNPVEFNGNWIERNNFNNPGTLVAQPAGQPNGSTAAAAGASTFSGVISQSAGAGLTMAGPGTQVLSGANTYSGPTTISAGQLPLANPNLANGRIILNNDQQSGGQANFGITNGFANPSVNYGAQPAFAQSINPAQMANMAPRVPQSYSSPVPGPVAHGSGEQGAKPAPAQQPPARQSGGRDEQKRELAEYQQKVSMAWRSGQSQGQPQGSKYNDDSNLFDRKGGDKPAPPPAKAAITGNFDMLVDLSNTGLVLDGSGPTAPAGLASLDFELPTDNSLYELFRFTTPRGDAELSARTVSNSTLVRLELLLGIVAAGLAVWAAFALIRRGVLRGFCHPLGAVVLIVAGLVSLIANVLPYAGLLALLAGIVLLIARLFGCCRRKVAA